MDENIELKRKSPFGVASLILGIVSIVFDLFWYISLPTGILAIIFGAKSIKKVGSKLGKAGLILGIIGLCLLILIYASAILLVLLASY